MFGTFPVPINLVPLYFQDMGSGSLVDKMLINLSGVHLPMLEHYTNPSCGLENYRVCYAIKIRPSISSWHLPMECTHQTYPMIPRWLQQEDYASDDVCL